MKSRRKFIKGSLAVSAGFSSLGLFTSSSAKSKYAKGEYFPKYGPLERKTKNIIDVPNGFSVKVISQRGQLMDDGFYVPGKPDGMAAFQLDESRTAVVRNHETTPDQFSSGEGPWGTRNELLPQMHRNMIYDYGNGTLPCIGGTSTFIYNHNTGEVETQYLSLAGTIRNCAGGLTPWGTWITCEEAVDRKGGYYGKLEKNHGYNFEVQVSPNPRMSEPVPLKEMGRFNHEAVAVNPQSGIVFQTEDRGDGLFYRYIPNVKGQLAKGGKLQALALRDRKSADTRNWPLLSWNKIQVGVPHDVEWIDLENVESPYDELRSQGYSKGAAKFARGEGAWWGDKEMYIACTNGGRNLQGQVFKYIPSPEEGQPGEKKKPGKLVLYAEPNDSALLSHCDNLTVAPWGDVVMCEDNESPRLVGINPEGQLYLIAHNHSIPSEFTGACFSPNGQTLFVNIQHAGMTLAIEGPW